MDGPSESHNESVGGMKSTSGSQGELSDRGGGPGFPSGTADTVSGSAASTPDRSKSGFENEI